jgi:Protein of unknown function (DUF3306)
MDASPAMSDDGFLSRWSRRKLAEKTVEAPREDIAAEDDIEPEESVATAETQDGVDAGEESIPPPRHPAEDIDIESLTKGSDFTIFMQTGVPAAVRRQALRKLWRTDPVLANLDGLNDYEDMEYTYGIGAVAKTDWKLGRGFLTDKDLGIESTEEADERVAQVDSGDTSASEELDEAVTETDPADDSQATGADIGDGEHDEKA